jgi:hypothetical protein
MLDLALAFLIPHLFEIGYGNTWRKRSMYKWAFMIAVGLRQKTCWLLNFTIASVCISFARCLSDWDGRYVI